MTDSVTPWTIACQAPLSMGFSRQEYSSGLLFPPPGDLPHPGIEPESPALQMVSFPTESLGKPIFTYTYMHVCRSIVIYGFPGGLVGKESACNAGGSGSIPGWGRPLEKEMATHSSILVWEIPRTEKPRGLQSMGSQESDTI